MLRLKLLLGLWVVVKIYISPMAYALEALRCFRLS